MNYVICNPSNMFPPNTESWITDNWVRELDKAKIFKSLEEAKTAHNKLSWHCYITGIHMSTHYTIREVYSFPGDGVSVREDKATVLSLLDSITKNSVREADVPDMIRIINYVKET